MPKDGVSVYTQYPETDCRESVSKLIIERLATEDDLEESHMLEEIGESIWTFSAEIHYCPYCGSELTAPSDIQAEVGEDKDRYGAFSLFDQENWKGRARWWVLSENGIDGRHECRT